MTFDICTFHEDYTEKWYVAPKKKYPSAFDFIEAVKKNFRVDIELYNVYDGHVRFEPCGDPCGEDWFTFADVSERGAFAVWICNIPEVMHG
jgi:hypothetical protein